MPKVEIGFIGEDGGRECWAVYGREGEFLGSLGLDFLMLFIVNIHCAVCIHIIQFPTESLINKDVLDSMGALGPDTFNKV